MARSPLALDVLLFPVLEEVRQGLFAVEAHGAEHHDDIVGKEAVERLLGRAFQAVDAGPIFRHARLQRQKQRSVFR